ncbi:predicted protein [Phaeodactylum tricornutum CCAP 1055/1]|uniref:Uncharacterized protein n=1 Tax=Phaeodactylum tricornutum (strain CCAP 1055/1) TaxID=556484 RepID=B7FUC5_PHATC|nr:predicted protein [Phaeodactylum tricornutum CCAP 1055/1]EEC49962.1 predicted protein [Phaeodactylum tricornutum CCAP 1055/1]|eukprot:XP_002178297.1 predicted protein [Phaeodactylum tricornutum CCAP 1055/1]
MSSRQGFHYPQPMSQRRILGLQSSLNRTSGRSLNSTGNSSAALRKSNSRLSMSSSSDTTPVIQNNNISKRRFIPPSRRVDNGDDEISIGPPHYRGAAVKRSEDTKARGHNHSPKTACLRHTQKPLTPTRPKLSPARSRNRLTGMMITSARPPSLRHLDQGESTRSFLSASSTGGTIMTGGGLSKAESNRSMDCSRKSGERSECLRSMWSRAESARSLSSFHNSAAGTTAPDDGSLMDRAESNRSFCSYSTQAEFEFFAALQAANASSAGAETSNVDLSSTPNHLHSDSSARTPTPPDLLRLTTQSSVRRLVKTKISSAPLRSRRVPSLNSTDRPDNPVAIQLRQQISTGTAVSGKSGGGHTNASISSQSGLACSTVGSAVYLSDDDDSSLWVDEVPTVLTARRSTGSIHSRSSPGCLDNGSTLFLWHPLPGRSFEPFRRASM